MMTTHDRKISVIGLGYVGLPVAVALGQNSKVIGFDVNPERIEALKNNRDNTGEVSKNELSNSNVLFTSLPADLAEADFHIIAVPTPVNNTKHPELVYLEKASALLSAHLKKQ